MLINVHRSGAGRSLACGGKLVGREWCSPFCCSGAVCFSVRTATAVSQLTAARASGCSPHRRVRRHPTDGTIVYVPVYSSLYLGVSTRAQTVDLAATVSVRNTSSVHPITLHWVRYYDSSGKKVRDYLDKPSALPPLGSVEFVIQRSDAAGGPGANFLIRWDGPANVDEPLIEAVMFGQSGNAGVSFTSRGQVVKSAPRE